MNHFGILAKYWQPGAVKTRLATAIGDESASRLYRSFVESLLRRLDSTADQRVLAVTPAERMPEFQQLAGPAWTVVPQVGGDLGARLQAVFADQFRRGARRVVLIGSDSPTLPRAYVDDAFARLDEYPVVLGPADDGGYYLVGAADRIPPIFSKIEWSTSRVFAQTAERLRSAGCPFATLPLWYDVDDLAGLERLKTELRQPLPEQFDWADLRRQVELVTPTGGQFRE